MGEYLTGPYGCGDCGYGCCCKCRNPQCTLCQKKDNPDREGSAIHCEGGDGTHAYICFGCRYKWRRGNTRGRDYKARYSKAFDKEASPEREKLVARYYETPCPHCGKEGVRISAVVRPPQSRDDKAWELLEKLQRGDGLTRVYGTLSTIWGGIGCTLHEHPDEKKALAAPKTMREYSQWVEYMNSTYYQWIEGRLYLRHRQSSHWHPVK